jgi:hypothetical protein
MKYSSRSPSPRPSPAGRGGVIGRYSHPRKAVLAGCAFGNSRWLPAIPSPSGRGSGRGRTLTQTEATMLKQAPGTTRIARNLRLRESWSERLMWAWLRDRRFTGYKFRRSIRLGPIFWISFVMAQNWTSKWMAFSMARRKTRSMMQSAMRSWKARASRSCGSGVRI